MTPLRLVRGGLFFHSGDLGDIIYGLLTIQALGGGKLILGHQHGMGMREPMTPARFDLIRDLLVIQPKVSAVEYSQAVPESCVNLNVFRRHVEAQDGNLPRTLADAQLLTFGLPRANPRKPWLNVDTHWVLPDKPIVVNRTARYRDPHFQWKMLVRRYGARMFFVGLEEEWKDFCDVAEKIEYVPTTNLLEVARLIAGAKVFIGNQSVGYAIAEGFKKNNLQESRPEWPDCLFPRPNARYSRDQQFDFPEGWLA